MFVSGRFGLKAFDITRPEQPVLLDWLGDGVDDPILPDGSPQPNRKGLLDDMWENEDVSVDQDRKLVFLSRDPRAYGGNTNSGESGVYIIDARHPERLEVLSYVRVPAGHRPRASTTASGCGRTAPQPRPSSRRSAGAGVRSS
jgi:hypothetical protein